MASLGVFSHFGSEMRNLLITVFVVFVGVCAVGCQSCSNAAKSASVTDAVVADLPTDATVTDAASVTSTDVSDVTPTVDAGK